MKIALVLRNKKNALKLSTKTLETFVERIKTDTKDGADNGGESQIQSEDCRRGILPRLFRTSQE